jgi:hypothetical protein
MEYMGTGQACNQVIQIVAGTEGKAKQYKMGELDLPYEQGTPIRPNKILLDG